MKYIFLFLILFSSLFSETFEEYQDSVEKDIVAFDKKYGQLLYAYNKETYNTFHKANGDILVRTIMIKSYIELDLITIAYLDYKSTVEIQLKERLLLFNIIQKIKKGNKK